MQKYFLLFYIKQGIMRILMCRKLWIFFIGKFLLFLNRDVNYFSVFLRQFLLCLFANRMISWNLIRLFTIGTSKQIELMQCSILLMWNILVVILQGINFINEVMAWNWRNNFSFFFEFVYVFLYFDKIFCKILKVWFLLIF